MQIKHGTLVMVADGTKMLLFRNEGDEKFIVLETLEHEVDANPKSSDQGTDTPGRVQSRVGSGRSSYDETDWHQQSEDEFARTAAGILESAAEQHGDAGIVVISAPRTLGELRKQYGGATKKAVICEIDKDLANHTTDHIAEVIAAQ
ncbi:host attachment family protein [Aurantiacibacter sp. MUD11]|uniref:host attachment family protein n=1 Tax=Aurantiacibacter sp. MUD11 TaxID=3003265 RepID=UPI0022A9FE40|nr:host attachment family protein [Aurantiacibacter sp. MUD11]WAT18933.1 host attachment family protein [Aurantiacibacter sp. MUD11]